MSGKRTHFDGKGNPMTQKELQKLRRQDLLELLLAQGEESARISAELEECRKKLESLEVTYERIRKRLDVKDAIIHELKESLEAERTQRQIKLEDAGSIAEASLRLNGIFEAAQEAADQYLYNVRLIGKRQADMAGQEAKPAGE